MMGLVMSIVAPNERKHLSADALADSAIQYLRKAVELGQLAYYPEGERKQHIGDFARRLGVLLAELERQSGNLGKYRDEFMTGFWSGYSLQGYDRPRKSKDEYKQPVTQTQE